MEKLSTQDIGFLRIETPHCPCHVAGLMILKLPEKAPGNYLRQLAAKLGKAHQAWPLLSKKLDNPTDISDAAWVEAEDFAPERHIFHYSLPGKGSREELLSLITRTHEQPLDRYRPLWEIHLVEGLPGNRFALYCKIHHAVVDGVAGMRIMQSLFSDSPQKSLEFNREEPKPERSEGSESLFSGLGKLSRELVKHYQAIPELSSLLAHMGLDAIKGNRDAMRLPFTAPRSLFNTMLDSRRSIGICELPITSVKRIAKKHGGSINDVLLAICGGALRQYLLAQNALPKTSLVAGVPVALKSSETGGGNRLCYIMCPYFTEETNDLRRLKKVIAVTKDAKAELSKLSGTASRDYYSMVALPMIFLNITGNATLLRPHTNVILSNVPGAHGKVYIDGSEVEFLYPLTAIMDGLGLNITVISHGSKLCVGVASCPSTQPGIEDLSSLITSSYRDLQQSVFPR